MLESVLFLNFKPFAVCDSLGERIRVFYVGNGELLFQNCFTLSMPRPSRFIYPRVTFGKLECGSL